MTAAETLDHIRRLLASSPAFRVGLIEVLVEAGIYSSRVQRRQKRIKTACEILASGERRQGAQGMLRERFEVSRATAYRDLEQAIHIKQGTLFD